MNRASPRSRAAALGAVLALLAAGGAGAVELVETPYLKDEVAAGRLPPVGRRVPMRPSVVEFSAPDRTIG
ncbi:MAG: hypothetical protein ACE5JZ_09895, partial [Kiloniellales bacterium]